MYSVQRELQMTATMSALQSTEEARATSRQFTGVFVQESAVSGVRTPFCGFLVDASFRYSTWKDEHNIKRPGDVTLAKDEWRPDDIIILYVDLWCKTIRNLSICIIQRNRANWSW
jgi:hypothetical protein